MKVRTHKRPVPVYNSVPSPQEAREPKSKKFPAPTKGLTLVENLAVAQPGGAQVLDNWIVNQQSIRPRGGTEIHATIGDQTTKVESMFVYRTPSTEKMFAASSSGIFDITSGAFPTTVKTPVVTGQNSGKYSTVQMTTAGGNYLYAFNGADDAQLFDGETWKLVNDTSSPAITGVDTSRISYAWKYANRIFMVEKDTNNIWVLPVDSIGGAAIRFTLDGIFAQGSGVMFGSTWSTDSGEGLDDKCAIVSNTGEVAIYSGTNPADPNNWSLQGLYTIGIPLGQNAHCRSGGDIFIATTEGLVPLYEATRKDTATLSLSSASHNIEPLWQEYIARRGSKNWQILKWDDNNLLLVAAPTLSTSEKNRNLAANLETGAWSQFVGMNPQCYAVYKGSGYYGGSQGTIHQMDVGGNDDGIQYVCSYIGNPDDLNGYHNHKVVHSARSIFRAVAPFNAQVGVNTNYDAIPPSPPDPIEDYEISAWNVGSWDRAVWDAIQFSSVTTEWTSVGRSGFSFLPRIQISNRVTPLPAFEFVAFDILYEDGEVMV